MGRTRLVHKHRRGGGLPKMIEEPSPRFARDLCTPSYVTQIRKNVYQRLFNKAGKADDLDEYIMSLS